MLQIVFVRKHRFMIKVGFTDSMLISVFIFQTFLFFFKRWIPELRDQESFSPFLFDNNCDQKA